MPATINGILVQDQANSTLAGSAITPTGNAALAITPVGTYLTGDGTASAEVSAYDRIAKELYVINNVSAKVEIVTVSATGSLAFSREIDVSTLPGYGGMNSVAVSGTTVAVAIQNVDGSTNGLVALYSTTTGALITTVTVGVVPDMVTFTPDGRKLLVANEGERDLRGTSTLADDLDPPGSISLIDLSGGAAGATVQTLGFGALDGQETALRALGVRLTPGRAASVDLEPEYITVSSDSRTAYVTLQEANSVAVYDVSGTIPVLKTVLPLGFVDHSIVGNEADYSDRDFVGTSAGRINLHLAPIKGLLMPDAIASWNVGGITYFATANEGDARVDDSDTVRLSTLDLNDAVFGASEATLKNEDDAGRLNVSSIDGDTNTAVAGLEEIYTFGGRGFTVFRQNADGSITKVDESGGEFEKIVAAQQPALFNNNQTGTAAGFDTRSDDKAGEPEGITIANVGGRNYAFVVLERQGGIMVYDVSDPSDIKFSQYIASTAADTNNGPEVVRYIDAVDSPTGKGLIITSNEVSGSISAYQAVPQTYKLQLLHMSDGEGSTLTPTTAPILGALIDRFNDQYASTLVLAGGDNFIPGPFLTAGADPSLNAIVGTTALGRPDIAIYNAFGVNASNLGNHEFDLGSQVLRDAFSASGSFPGAQFPYLSANLDFSGDSALASVVTGAGQEASTIKGKIAPSAVVTLGGERIGVVGATTQVLERISSPSGTEVNGFPKAGQPGDNQVEADDMALLAAQLQPVIDALIAQGVNKIVVQSHLQILGNEQALAPLLRGVDIILAAGSHTRLGDATDVAASFPSHDANFAGTYPIRTTGADGKPTLIVATDSESTYLGRLVVDFDTNGEIVLGSLDPAISGAYAATQASLDAAYGADIGQAFAAGSIGARVQQITGAVNTVIQTKESTFYGFSNVYLEGDRVFGRAQETNLGDLSADANAFVAQAALPTQPFLVSLKNGGGIRASVGSIADGSGNSGDAGTKLPTEAVPSAGKPAGAISQLDIENALRFDNKLMVFDTTPQGLLNILNYGAGLAPGNGGFPQIGGVKFSYDPTKPAGSRVQDVALTDSADRVIARIADNGALLADAPSLISIVSLNFTANGGDGYPTKANGENFRYLLAGGTLSAPVSEALDFTLPANIPANVVGEQKALQDFLRAEHATAATAYGLADTPANLDMRIQNLSVRADAVFDSPAVQGTGADETFTTTRGNDRIEAGPGDDTIVSSDAFASLAFSQSGAFFVFEGPNGRDLVRSGEHFRFADGVIDREDGGRFNALVDDLYYYGTQRDVYAAKVDAETHYRTFGAAEGRDPNAFFSTKGYLSANPDVARAGVNPLDHYLAFGVREGRDPSALFDNETYLRKYADVAASNLNPLEHFVRYGQAEGREASPAIGTRADISPIGFDREYYLLANPDVGQRGANPLGHYVQSGAREGRDPNAYFDTDAYLAANPDVAANRGNPLEHYHLFGFKEGRDPSASFDTSTYLATYQDIARAGIDPLLHYLQFGAAEGRSTFADGTLLS